jgi:Asp-tRNA(Asn)/Glu-tRNA(Gln) amidotransferase A subunit family amidase
MVPVALGTQVVGSILRPASFCGCVGFKPSVGRINRGGSYDYFSQSCTGVLAASLEDAWLVAVNITARAGGDPGYPGLQGPAEPPPPRRPRALAVLQTSGWEEAAPKARAAFAAAAARLAAAGIALADRHADPVIEEVEGAIADSAQLTRTINAWEGRWPLNTYRDRDARAERGEVWALLAGIWRSISPRSRRHRARHGSRRRAHGHRREGRVRRGGAGAAGLGARIHPQLLAAQRRGCGARAG